MQGEHRQWLHSAAGVPIAAVELTPPLRLNWSLEGGAGVPLVCSGQIFVTMQRSIRCITPDSRKIWTRRGDFYGLCAGYQFLLAATERRRHYANYLFDQATGIDRCVNVGAYVAVLLSDECHFIGTTYHKNRRDSVGLYSLPSFAEVWRRDAEEFSPTYNFEGGVAAAEGRVFVGTGPSLTEGDGLLIALREANGETLWSVDLKDVGGPTQGGSWEPMVSHGLLVINTAGGTVAFETSTGRLVWTVPPVGARAIYGDRIYIESGGKYFIVDLESGIVLIEQDLSAQMKKIDPRFFSLITTRINVSETHVFAGDSNGGLWAWERETGDVVWHHRPKGADAFIGVLPVIAGRRLYVASSGFGDRPSYLYCYQEDRSESGSAQEASVPAETAPAKKATAAKPKARKKACPGYR